MEGGWCRRAMGMAVRVVGGWWEDLRMRMDVVLGGDVNGKGGVRMRTHLNWKEERDSGLLTYKIWL